ncbi:hypothetical protein P20439_0200 [Pseudoalteromonas sp. BSi20439]|nr:hypothetical protein P20439_0200 [Pseudoalteromonas sp. BSi20439]
MLHLPTLISLCFILNLFIAVFFFLFIDTKSNLAIFILLLPVAHLLPL